MAKGEELQNDWKGKRGVLRNELASRNVIYIGGSCRCQKESLLYDERKSIAYYKESAQGSTNGDETFFQSFRSSP